MTDQQVQIWNEQVERSNAQMIITERTLWTRAYWNTRLHVRKLSQHYRIVNIATHFIVSKLLLTIQINEITLNNSPPTHHSKVKQSKPCQRSYNWFIKKYQQCIHTDSICLAIFAYATEKFGSLMAWKRQKTKSINTSDQHTLIKFLINIFISTYLSINRKRIIKELNAKHKI